jgi:hypothetical protein
MGVFSVCSGIGPRMHLSLWSNGLDEYLRKRSAQMIKAGRLCIIVKLLVQHGRLGTYNWRPSDASRNLGHIERSCCNKPRCGQI